MPQAVPCPDKPPTGLGGPPIQPGRRALPELLRGVIKVQNTPRMAGKALLKQAPQPTATVAEPDHLRCATEPLAHRFGPQPRGERVDVPQHGHQPALDQACDHLSGPRAM